MIEARRNGNGMGRLLAVMRTLRAPGGCPWDREQTLPDLKTCLLEETYELLDAMAGDDIPHHAEELGDVLLQIVFQCQIREEEGRFNFDDVANTLADKLIRRHPHVFAGSTAADSGAVLKQWEAIKKTEKAEDGGRSALAGVPRHLPALLRAQRIQGKAANSGFDWPDHSGAAAKITEETAELEDAVASGDKAAMTHEVGDLLF